MYVVRVRDTRTETVVVQSAFAVDKTVTPRDREGLFLDGCFSALNVIANHLAPQQHGFRSAAVVSGSSSPVGRDAGPTWLAVGAGSFRDQLASGWKLATAFSKA